MNKAFMCSLCHNGILGGALYLDENSVTYKTNKLTVDKAYRNLILPLDEIAEKLGCRLHMYEKLGHAAYEEAQDFNQMVYDFLSE